MLEYVVYLLASYSLTFAWMESPLFESFRKKVVLSTTKLNYLGKCYHCSGFWISLALAVVMFDFQKLYMYPIYALSSCIVSAIADMFVTLIDRINVYVIKNRYINKNTSSEQ
jgi:hypothetical protein